MEKIIVTLVGCFAALVGFGIVGRFQTNVPEIRAYKKYINNSRKVESQDAVDGMAAAAGVIEAIEPKMGTLALAFALADDIKVTRDGYGGFIDGASLILNKLDVLLDCEKRYSKNSFKYLVPAMTQEIESAIRQEQLAS